MCLQDWLTGAAEAACAWFPGEEFSQHTLSSAANLLHSAPQQHDTAIQEKRQLRGDTWTPSTCCALLSGTDTLSCNEWN